MRSRTHSAYFISCHCAKTAPHLRTPIIKKKSKRKIIICLMLFSWTKRVPVDVEYLACQQNEDPLLNTCIGWRSCPPVHLYRGSDSCLWQKQAGGRLKASSFSAESVSGHRSHKPCRGEANPITQKDPCLCNLHLLYLWERRTPDTGK